jgi:tetratricopeptide (TPR) repeat protein
VYALGCVLYEMVTGRVPFTETASRSYQDHHVNSPAPSMRALRADVPDDLDALVLTMMAKRPSQRPDAEAVYDALLPLVRSGAPTATEDRDPRRPFLRPLAPAARSRAASGPAAPPDQAASPLDVDEAVEIQQRVAELMGDSHLQQAIDVLDSAVHRAAHDPELQREMQIDLATTLYLADEFTRAARVLDALLPKLERSEDAAVLWYYAGVSHAEIGEVEPAVGYLTTYLADADPASALYRDALYQLGMMLPAIGRIEEGLRYLNQLRPILVAEYGPDSIHVTSLDRRIAQVMGRHH